jgi:hypothetical protein
MRERVGMVGATGLNAAELLHTASHCPLGERVDAFLTAATTAVAD